MRTKAGTETGALLYPAITGTPVFDASISRLGLLTGEQVGPVLEAYVTLKEMDRSLSLFSAPDGSGHYRAIGVQRVRDVEHMLRSLLGPLDAAIAALAPHCGFKVSDWREEDNNPAH